MPDFINWIIPTLFSIVMALVGFLHKQNSDKHNKTSEKLDQLQKDIGKMKTDLHSVESKMGTNYMTRQEIKSTIDDSIRRMESIQRDMMKKLDSIDSKVQEFNQQHGRALEVMGKFFDDSAMDKLKKG